MSASEQPRAHELFCPYVERIISTQTIVKSLTTGNGVEARVRSIERRLDVLTVLLILGFTLDNLVPAIWQLLFP